MQFELFHAAIREPVDLYHWGNSFFSSLLIFEDSHVHGAENLAKIADYLSKGENVFLLANHQVREGHAKPLTHDLTCHPKVPQFNNIVPEGSHVHGAENMTKLQTTLVKEKTCFS